MATCVDCAVSNGNGSGSPATQVGKLQARMLMLKVVQQYNKNLICFPLNNLLVVYRDIQNGVGMPVQTVRSTIATATASASAIAWHYQNANAKGCIVIE